MVVLVTHDYISTGVVELEFGGYNQLGYYSITVRMNWKVIQFLT